MAQYRIIKLSKKGSSWYQVECKSYFTWNVMNEHKYYYRLSDAEKAVDDEQAIDADRNAKIEKEVIREYR